MSTIRIADQPASHLVEHLFSLARVLTTEQLQAAGHKVPDYNGVVCKSCGVPTADDGDKFCPSCMPYCVECDQPTNDIDADGMCPTCADPEACAIRRRSGQRSLALNAHIDQSREALAERADRFIDIVLGG